LAGDKKVYEKAINRGLNLAWEGKWEQALAAYQKALAEMPDDPLVHNYLGLVYSEMGRLEPALEAYRRAHQLDPEDPAPLLPISEVLERAGQRRAAAEALLELAEIHKRHKAWAQAIDALQRATNLYPDHLRAQSSLAELYVQLGQMQRAAKEYLNLARLFQRQGRVQEALDQCRRVLEIDPRNAEARTLGEALQLGKPVVQPGADSTSEEGASPVDLARDKALQELAGIPFEDVPVGDLSEADLSAQKGTAAEAGAKPALSRAQIDALIAQAIDYQTRGFIDEAIACYAKVIDAGVDRPAAHFNLGLLYQQRLRFEPAVSEFEKAVRHKSYALGSHFALGQCYKAQGAFDKALEHLVQALKIVDLATVNREQADDLIELYDALATSYLAKGHREKALEFTNALVKFLSGKGWEDKVRTARQRLDGLADDDVTMSLAEIVAVPDPEKVLSAVSLSQEYMKRGALTAATEICYQAIGASPGYLPLHLRLAEVFCQDGRVDDGVAKYLMVANLYLVRKDARQAIGVYKRVLHLTPLDVVVRSRLIDLLTSSGEIDQALEQYLALADAYFQVAQPDKAVEKYAEALRLAPRASDEKEWRLCLLRKVGELQLRRGNWREACALYQEIVVLSPDDERARLNLIDLYCKVGLVKKADKEVVSLIEAYRSHGDEKRVIPLLEEAVRLQPKQMALRARLARVYIDAGLREEAVHELDALGELQLDAGLREQAAATIRLIVSLKPENVESYRQLLSQF
jgi:tetratricopeptide (TPR) repeat protein